MIFIRLFEFFLSILDNIAGSWLDLRTDWRIQNTPELRDVGFENLSANKKGLEITLVSPMIAVMADEASKMLSDAAAENYIQFDMLPRVDRNIRPIRVTVQWADGKSPAELVQELKKQIESLEVRHEVHLEELVITKRIAQEYMDIITRKNFPMYFQTCAEKYHEQLDHEGKLFCHVCGHRIHFAVSSDALLRFYGSRRIVVKITKMSVLGVSWFDHLVGKRIEVFGFDPDSIPKVFLNFKGDGIPLPCVEMLEGEKQNG